MKKVDFFFDLSSPYSYLAATQMQALGDRTGADIAWRPMVLGAVFKAVGNEMPARVPQKGRWMGRDLDQRAPAVALAGFRAMWAEDRDITRDDELRRIAEMGGLDPASALAAIENPAVKERLRANTDEAVARGAFGAPTFLVGDELYWGNDRLHFVEAALRRQ